MNKLLICSVGSIGRKYINTIKKSFKNIDIAVYRTGNGIYYKELSLINTIFSNLSDALNWQPDYAIICSPAPFHLENAITIARRNIPLLIEKPLCTLQYKESQINELKNLSKKQIILIGYLIRHEKGFSFLKNLLYNKVIGKPIRAYCEYGSWLPEWRSGSNYLNGVSANKKLGGGVLLELSHEIDLVNGLFGFCEVCGSNLSISETFDIDVEDKASIILKNSENIDISIQIDFCTKPSTRNLTIKGTEGMINWDLLKKKIILSRNKTSNQKKEVFNVRSDGFTNQLSHFFKCCDEGKEPLVSVSDGFRVIEIIKCVKSLK